MENIVYQSKKLRKERTKLAVFDVDWTLIHPKDGRRFPKDKDDWQFLFETVPTVLKRYHRKDYQIVFLTDQSKPWKVDMIKDVIKSLDLPITALIAMKKEEHKPNPAFFQRVFGEKAYSKEDSIYVGDAAGRVGDWAAKDKEVAETIGLRFFTPEEMFAKKNKKANVKRMPVEPSKEREVIIMVGFPASGKSTIAQEVFEKEGYHRMDGDTLKTPEKMIKEASKYIDTSSVVFDATNGSKEKRAKYIAFATKHGVPVRCVWKTTSMEESMKQNRERHATGIPKIPDVAYYLYRKHFQEPTEEEGCKVIAIQ